MAKSKASAIKKLVTKAAKIEAQAKQNAEMAAAKKKVAAAQKKLQNSRK